MNPNPQLRANIRFLPHGQEGGRRTLARSGVRPQLKVQNLYTSCYVWGEKQGQEFLPETDYDVGLELLFWDEYKDSIYPGMPVELNEGSRVVARGVVKDILTQL